MPHVTTTQELFTHELQDLYYAEKALTKTLPQLAKEATDRELKKAFESHLAETEEQVGNLERVFDQIGERAKAQPCAGIEGIKKEHDEFVDGNGARGAVLDTFLTGAAARAEHYEIAAYTGLVTMARALGHRDSVKLLQANLKQEQEALKKVEAISKRLVRSKQNGGGSLSAQTSRTSRARKTTRR